MRAITIRQPWASLTVAGIRTVETRSRPMSYRGRVAIHAAQRPARFAEAYEAWCAVGTLVGESGDVVYNATRGRAGALEVVDALPLGAVVGSAVVIDCVPIVRRGTPTVEDYERRDVALLTDADRGLLLDRWDEVHQCDLTDQLALGDFSPGRWAILLDDPAPTTERCPWCWGGVLDGRGETLCRCVELAS